MSTKGAAVGAWESLFRAQVSVMRSLAETFPTHDISLNEYDVLFNLSREPGRAIRQRDLNRKVLLTQPSVSRLIDRLVARSLVEKLADSHDKRGTIIGLTDKGFDLFRRVAVSHMSSIEARVGAALTVPELQHLTVLCDKLREPAAGSVDATTSNPSSTRTTVRTNGSD